MRLCRSLTASVVALAIGLSGSAAANAGDGPESLDAVIGEAGDQLADTVRGLSLTLAVPDLTCLNGRATVLGRYVADELVTVLFTRGVQVVERNVLDRALAELRLGMSDLFDPGEAKRFGRLVGAEAIVVGTLTDLGRTVKLNARVVHVETGQVFGAAAVVFQKDALVSDMFVRTAPPRPTPVPRMPRRAPTPSTLVWSEDFSAYSDGDPLPDWGPSVILRRYANGRRFMLSQLLGMNTVSRSVALPENFSFQFDVLVRSSRATDFVLVLVDQKSDDLRVDFGFRKSGRRLEITLPGAETQAITINAPPTIKLVRRGAALKVYVNGSFVATGVYANYARFIGFKLVFPNNLMFGDFCATRLPSSADEPKRTLLPPSVWSPEMGSDRPPSYSAVEG